MSLEDTLRAIKPSVLGWTYRVGTWTPTYTGFSADPVASCRYQLYGNVCLAMVSMTTAGTSNATTFTVSAPFPAADPGSAVYWMAGCGYTVDNSAAVDEGYVQIENAGTAFTVNKSTGAAWTASGTKRAYFEIAYEVA